MQINQFIDHTLLKATATTTDIKNLCQEAINYKFYAVCVNSCYINLAKEELNLSNVKIASVIGFPLGANTTNSKIFEAQESINNGANEIDMVLNIGLLKSAEFKNVEHEVTQIKKVIGNNILKVIFENCYLTDNEKRIACKIAINSGADFIKTSTGFGTSGVTTDDILLMKTETKGLVKIKASGGVKDLKMAEKYLKLGVDRIGTSSGVNIMNSILK